MWKEPQKINLHEERKLLGARVQEQEIRSSAERRSCADKGNASREMAASATVALKPQWRTCQWQIKWHEP